MSRVLFAGSFDPPTLAHLNLIERAALLFPKLFVGVAHNLRKTHPLLPHAERVAFLKEACKRHSNVEVIEIKGLTVDWARQHEIDFLLRGVRSSGDMDVEYGMATANFRLGQLETLFLPTDPRYSWISSTLIREIAREGGSLREFVSPEIEYLLSMHKY